MGPSTVNTQNNEVTSLTTVPVPTIPPNTMSIPIFNLSKHILSSDEVSLLSRGLSFVPADRSNFFKLQEDLLLFFRRIPA